MEKKYCAAPWRGLHINFRGDIKTCCAGDPNLLGNINHIAITDILESTKLKEVRESIKQGILHPEYCYNCIQAERNGSSERDWHNNVNEDFDPSTADINQPHVPVICDIRWNNTCNLACKYCMPYCSSKWASIMGEYEENSVRPYYQDIVDFVKNNQAYTKEVALVGGEPLLLKENEHLLDVIPEDTLITLITNLSVDFNKNKVAQKLFNKKRVGWSMSFDNVGERFEYVRYGSTWSLMNNNVRTIKDKFSQGHHGGVHAVYNLYNCTRLRELKRYTNEVGITILWQTLYQPEYLDPMNHNQNIRELAIQEIDAYFLEFDVPDGEKVFFNSVKTNLQNKIETDSNQSTNFKNRTIELETNLHPKSAGKFEQLWPEIAQAL